RALATKYNYTTSKLESPSFPLVKATGFNVKDWQDLILVNQVGKRFYDETKGDVPHGNNGGQVAPYTPGDYRNAENVKYNPTKYNFTHAALAMNEYSGPPDYCAGPVWAIFDAEAVAREGWKVTPPHVDPDGYFFAASTLAELAAAIKNEYQARPMKGDVLEATVARYNSMVDGGVDMDFGKPAPQYKIQTPPFYAAWATPVVHDTRAGLRINARCQVIDMAGKVTPGLYCAGESAGGFNQHGMGRCATQGFICGIHAAAEPDGDRSRRSLPCHFRWQVSIDGGERHEIFFRGAILTGAAVSERARRRARRANGHGPFRRHLSQRAARAALGRAGRGIF